MEYSKLIETTKEKIQKQKLQIKSTSINKELCEHYA